MKLAKCALFLAMAIPQLALAHQAGDFYARRYGNGPSDRGGQIMC